MFTIVNMTPATDTRRRILDATQALYLEGGMDALTMRAVAERVGVSATALYRHFRNKEEMLATVLDQGFEVFGSYLQRCLAAPTPMERMTACGDEYVRFAAERRPYYELLFMSGAKRAVHMTEDCVAAHRHSTFQLLVDRVTECMDTGVLARDDAQEVALSIWSASHGLVGLYYEGVLPDDVEQFLVIYRRSIERLFAGLRSHS